MKPTDAMAVADIADKALAAFFAFALFGNISVDVWMGADIDLRTTGIGFHQTVYASGAAYDPLFLANGPYMRWSALATAWLYAPYYAAAIPTLLRGDGLGSGWLRQYAWLYAIGMLVNMSIVLALELRELVAATSLAPSLGAYWIPTGAYWLVPLYVLDRLVREQIMTQLLTRSGRKAS